MLRADLHIHSSYSADSSATLEDIVAHCLRKGINCVALTDHNTIAGALKMKQIAPFTVIVGEEILTTSGEIIGFFLTEEIPARLPAEEAVARIKSQGGLVCIPHPFDHFRPSAMHRHALEALLPDIDIIEVFNSRTLLYSDLAKAQQLAQTNGLLASAGSDAHIPSEIGNAYVEMPEFSNQDEFRLALAQGKIFGRRANPWRYMVATIARLAKRLKKH